MISLLLGILKSDISLDSIEECLAERYKLADTTSEISKALLKISINSPQKMYVSIANYIPY